MRHLESLPNRFNIPIKPDKGGYLGRECPIKACKGYFKITLGIPAKLNASSGGKPNGIPG